MENKYVKVPFDLELAKEITNGNKDGRIVTRDGRNARILCFDRNNKKYPIVGLIPDLEDNSGIEDALFFTNEGFYYDYGEKSNDDLMLEIPEYMTFKDGDILTYWPNGNRWCIFIYKNRDKDILSNYVTYDCDSRGNNILTFDKSLYASRLCSPSTESEKQSLIDALKESKEPRAKECLKKLGIEVNTKSEFKPFDKVLVRNPDDVWYTEFYSHYKKNESKYHYVTAGGTIWEYCIPYSDNLSYIIGTKTELNEIKW